MGAERLWRMLNEGGDSYVHALGALTGEGPSRGGADLKSAPCLCFYCARLLPAALCGECQPSPPLPLIRRSSFKRGAGGGRRGALVSKTRTHTKQHQRNRPKHILPLDPDSHLDPDNTFTATSTTSKQHHQQHQHTNQNKTGNQAVQMVAGGLRAIYLSGWQVGCSRSLLFF